MTNLAELRFRRTDLLAIALVVVIAVSVTLCFLPEGQQQAAKAQIYLNGTLIKTVSLQDDQVFLIEDAYVNEITVKNGAIAFTGSDCPGRDCVHSGGIRQSGRSLVCLPNRVEIRVLSEEADVDFVVG